MSIGEDALTAGLSDAFVELELFEDCDDMVLEALEGREFDPDASFLGVLTAGVATFFAGVKVGDDVDWAGGLAKKPLSVVCFIAAASFPFGGIGRIFTLEWSARPSRCNRCKAATTSSQSARSNILLGDC